MTGLQLSCQLGLQRPVLLLFFSPPNSYSHLSRVWPLSDQIKSPTVKSTCPHFIWAYLCEEQTITSIASIPRRRGTTHIVWDIVSARVLAEQTCIHTFDLWWHAYSPACTYSSSHQSTLSSIAALHQAKLRGGESRVGPRSSPSGKRSYKRNCSFPFSWFTPYNTYSMGHIYTPAEQPLNWSWTTSILRTAWAVMYKQ